MKSTWVGLALMITIASGCDNRSSSCRCEGSVPTGTLVALCGETHCVGGTLYTCTDDRLVSMGGSCVPGEDAGTVDYDAGVGVDAGPPRPCDESCSGCCDESGRCRSGDEDSMCGDDGDACALCMDGSECRDGACEGRRICTDGDDYECGDDLNEEWVGSQCCVDGVEQCVDGNDYDCTTGRVGFTWTGAQCCFEFEALCVGGDDYSCGTGSTIEHWTGSLCCVEGATECFPGESEYDCTTGRVGFTWTGTHCCTVP